MERKTISTTIGGKTITFETGKIAKQANGAVLVRVEDTIVFASACAAKEPSPTVDFFPLRVDYQEKFSSAGKSLGGFIKREGRPSQKEILTSRLIDRPIRPMFPEGFFNEVQLLTYVWSYDSVNSPEPLALCAASAALTISDIPLVKPIGAVRVGMIDGNFVINPTVAEQKESMLDLLIAGTEDAILMIEGYCDFLTEEQVLKAINTGHDAIKEICKTLAQWREEVGQPKMETTLRIPSDEIFAAIDKIMSPLIDDALHTTNKQERNAKMDEIKEKVNETLLPEGEESEHDPLEVAIAFKKLQSQYMRKMVLSEKARVDGRDPKEIRPIDVEQTLLPRTHGSSLFTRGETQSLAVCTLGGKTMAQRYETLDSDSAYDFYLQYFFPPFSVGECGRSGPPGRREVGHGKLAERALIPTLPSKDDFPYVIRLESNITECNGSSSMASVCGGTLALMDAGVPVKRPVSGIAMGLILEGDDFVILSDILGTEDALGDMDFKVTGDPNGITAFQMDIKVEGITPEIMAAALMQAKEGRAHILQKMLEVCPEPKSEMSIYAPRIETIQIHTSKIATVIGPGGKQIRAIVDETGVEIDIDDSGLISIASSEPKAMEHAKSIINNLTAEVEVGKTYEGKVVSIVPFGIFVEVLPGKEGLCHISEIDHVRVENINDHVKEGEVISVKVLDINERGQIKLSRKALLSKNPA